MTNSIFNGFRSFFGLPTAGNEPKNDFRNPIWGSEDEDDEDDELYHAPNSRNGELNIHIHTDPKELNTLMTQQMQDMFGMFSGVFGDMRSFFENNHLDHFGSTDEVTPADVPHEGNIRDLYLNPGYKDLQRGPKEDVDLDGKLSSEDIAGLLKRKDFAESSRRHLCRSAEGQHNVGGTFFQTIITQSVTKPDGSVETRRIVKDHLGNVEETVTSRQRDGSTSNDNQPIAEPFLQGTSMIADFSSLWKIF